MHEEETDHYVIAIRGTEGPLEWWDDFHVLLVPARKIAYAGEVAYGFSSIYGTLDIAYAADAVPAPAQSPNPAAPLQGGEMERIAGLTSGRSFAEKVGIMIKVHQAHHPKTGAARPDSEADVDLTKTEISIVGHSLGGALVTLFVIENDSKRATQMKPRVVHTFASPKVGNATFAAAFNALDVEKWRIFNAPDIVPMLPLGIEGFVHVDCAYGIDTRKVDDIKWTLPCFHALEAYLAALGDSSYLSGCHTATLDPPEAAFLSDVRSIARRALGIHAAAPDVQNTSGAK